MLRRLLFRSASFSVVSRRVERTRTTDHFSCDSCVVGERGCQEQGCHFRQQSLSAELSSCYRAGVFVQYDFFLAWLLSMLSGPNRVALGYSWDLLSLLDGSRESDLPFHIAWATYRELRGNSANRPAQVGWVLHVLSGPPEFWLWADSFNCFTLRLRRVG